MARKPSVPLEDWVAPLDKFVTELLLTSECPTPQEIDEDETLPFLVVRHPRLRERIVTTWPHSSFTTLERVVAANLETLKEIHVLDELSEQHASELAALLIDCQAKFEAWGVSEKTDEKSDGKSDGKTDAKTDLKAALAAWRDRSPRDWQRHVELLAKRGPGQLRMLKQRLSKINDAIEEFLKYARTLDRYLALEAISYVEQAQQALRQVRLREPDELQHLHDYTLKSHAFVIDPWPYAIQRLTGYLVHVCRLPRNDANVRVAKIGNRCWNWSVKFNEHFDRVDKWRDAPAIRQRLARAARNRNK